MCSTPITIVSQIKNNFLFFFPNRKNALPCNTVTHTILKRTKYTPHRDQYISLFLVKSQMRLFDQFLFLLFNQSDLFRYFVYNFNYSHSYHNRYEYKKQTIECNGARLFGVEHSILHVRGYFVYASIIIYYWKTNIISGLFLIFWFFFIYSVCGLKRYFIDLRVWMN